MKKNNIVSTKIITGINSWIKFSGTSINNRFLVIKDMKNPYLYTTGPFEINSRVVKIENSHPDFLWLNLPPFIFPKIRILEIESNVDSEYLNSWEKFGPEGFHGFVRKKNEFIIKKYNLKKWYVLPN
jgi:hypothetical protein